MPRVGVRIEGSVQGPAEGPAFLPRWPRRSLCGLAGLGTLEDQGWVAMMLMWLPVLMVSEFGCLWPVAANELAPDPVGRGQVAGHQVERVNFTTT